MFDCTVWRARAAAENPLWSAMATRAESWRTSIARHDDRYRLELLDRWPGWGGQSHLTAIAEADSVPLERLEAVEGAHSPVAPHPVRRDRPTAGPFELFGRVASGSWPRELRSSIWTARCCGGRAGLSSA